MAPRCIGTAVLGFMLLAVACIGPASAQAAAAASSAAPVPAALLNPMKFTGVCFCPIQVIYLLALEASDAGSSARYYYVVR